MDLKRWVISEHKGIGVGYEFQIGNLVPKEALNERPGGVGNSIAWLMWHLARTEDVLMHVVARGEKQILERDLWAEKIGYEEYRIGTGLQDAEVEEFTRKADPEQVHAYWRSVREETAAWLEASPSEVLEEVPDLAGRLATIPDILPADATDLAGFWGGRPVGFLLALAVIRHGYIHLGEMMSIRGRLGYSSGI